MSAHLKYLIYLMRHKWFVLVAGLRVGAPLWRLIVHDWSKFLPCEWFPYARYFYADAPSFEIEETWEMSFNRAWLHHQHVNPHHWQHWVLREDSGAVKLLEMPLHFTREMVADWMGAGRTITGKWEAAQWYAKNREIIQLHSVTRAVVETLLSGPQKEESKP